MATKSSQRKWLNLIFGIFLLIAGSIRIYNYLNGAEYPAFRLILSGVFIVAGIIGIYQFFNYKEDDK